MARRKAKKIGWTSAAAIVVANMVGTGAFTVLGLQLVDLQNTWTIISLWIVGGMVALFGAFSYAELGTYLPKSGGEYYFLSRIYHPLIGYLSGWVSLTVGFAASIALSAMAMGAYLEKFSRWDEKTIAAGMILLITLIHSMNLNVSRNFQNVFTLLKLGLITAIVTAGFSLPSEINSFDWSGTWKEELTSTSYAVALVYVTYAYSGWNAAAYIIGEIKAPKVNLPKALILGTLVVSILYILLQVVFLRQAPIEALQGKEEVGQIVGNYLFGYEGGRIISFSIAFLLISSISAMVWVGPRVVRAMANDHKIWQFLATDNASGIPVRAIWLQSGISIFLILTSSFREVLLYSGFVLQLFTTLSVGAVFLIRYQNKNRDSYRSPGFPFFQIFYLAISIWILVFLLYSKPRESIFGLVNLLLGAVSFWLSCRFSADSEQDKSS